jgi:hypothetical protein
MTIRPHVTLAVDQTRRKLIEMQEQLNEDAWQVIMDDYTHADAQQVQYIDNALELFSRLIDELDRAR